MSLVLCQPSFVRPIQRHRNDLEVAASDPKNTSLVSESSVGYRRPIRRYRRGNIDIVSP